MKKTIISLVLLCSIIIATIPMSAADNSDVLTLDEAKELIFNAYLFSTDIRTAPLLDYDNLGYTLSKDESGLQYDINYYELKNFNSYNEIIERAKEIYTEDISSYSYISLSTVLDKNQKEVPLLRSSDDGKIYGFDEAPQYQYIYLVDSNDDLVYSSSGGADLAGKFKSDDLVVRILDSNGNSAKAEVYLNYGWELKAYRTWVECDFSRTDAGWRISDCDYFDSLNRLYKTTFGNDSPSTGDPNVSRVWWLAGVSLAALVPAVCLVQRRRRRED